MQDLAINARKGTARTEGLPLSLTVLLPSFLALLWAIAMSSATEPAALRYWFWYVAFRNLSYLGIFIAVVWAVSARIRRRLSHSATVMMSSSVFAAVTFLWLASRAIPFGY